MTDLLASPRFKLLVAFCVQAVAVSIGADQLFVEPAEREATEARLTVEEAWEWKLRFCPDDDVALSAYQPLACRPPGAFCGHSRTCCSGVCDRWRCQ